MKKVKKSLLADCFWEFHAFKYVLSDEFRPIRSVLDFVLEQVAHLGPL